MKKFYRGLPVLCLLAIGLFLYNSNQPSNNNFEINLAPSGDTELRDLPAKMAAPMERMEQEFELTKDPALGRVPSERLIAALEIAKTLQSQTAQGFAPTEPWDERGPDNVGGRTRGIMFDPNDPNNVRVFAGGVAGGLWVTDDITDANEPWTKINDFQSNMAISQFAYDPNNTMTIYVGTGEGYFNADAVRGDGIFKSTDGGNTWAQLAATSAPAGPFSQVQDVAVTSSSAVIACTRQFGGTGGGVFRSSDGGSSWIQVLLGIDGSRCGDLEIASNGDIYAGMGTIFTTDGVYKSTDDGATWTKLNLGTNGFPLTGFERIELAVAQSNSDVVYSLTQDPTTRQAEGIRKSTDGGATWTSLTIPSGCSVGTSDFTRGQAWYNLIIQVNPNDENDIMVGGIDLHRSTDGGLTWQQMTRWAGFGGCGVGMPIVHADQHAIVFAPNSNGAVVFGHDGGIDYSPDVTVLDLPNNIFPTFINKNNDYNVTQYYAGALHPTAGSNVIIGGTQDNGTQRLNAAGISTSTRVIGGDGAFTHIDQTNPNIVYGSIQGVSVRYSTNGGLSFATVFSAGGGGSFINPSDYDNQENIYYAHFTATQIIRLTGSDPGPPAGGLVTLSNNVGGNITHLRTSEFSPAGTSTLYLGTNGGRIFRVADASLAPPLNNVELGNPGVAGSISSIDIGASENELLVTFSNYGVTSVWKSTDGGATWLDIEGNIPDMPVRWGVFHPIEKERVVVATEAGVWESDDINALNLAPTWTPTNVPLTRVDMLQWRTSDATILAATHGRGMWTSVFVDLPVELAGFDAVAQGNSAVLNWTTLSEENNIGFDIEHAHQLSSDDELSFVSLGNVGGQGTTNTEHSYSYTVSDLESGMHYFRLKQIDFDGQFEYSDQVQLAIELPSSLEMSSSYPNPFSDIAQFSLRVKEDDIVEVELYDIQGRKVQSVFSGEVQAGYATPLQLSGNGLSNGSYFLRAKSSNSTAVERVEFLK